MENKVSVWKWSVWLVGATGLAVLTVSADGLWPRGLAAAGLLLLSLAILHRWRRSEAERNRIMSAAASVDRELDDARLRLEAAYQVAAALGEAVELPQTLGRSLEQVVRALGLDGGQILLSEENQDRAMRLAQVFGPSDHFGDGQHVVEWGDCICGRAAASGAPVIVEDLSLEPGVAARPCPAGGFPSIASVPLRTSRRTLGVLAVRSCDPHHFALHDVQWLTTVASLLAAAIENAYVRTEMQHRIGELTDQVRQLAIIEERERIGREMHDGLAQTLGLLNLQIEHVKGSVLSHDWQAVDRELQLLDDYLGTAYVDVREALGSLRNANPEGPRFVSALEDRLRDFERRHAIQTTLVVKNGVQPICFSPLVEVALTRVIQEALTNVRRHAQASRVEVKVAREGSNCEIAVLDDGVGFDQHQVPVGSAERLGLKTMRERVEELGGRFSIISRPGEGTRVTIEVACSGCCSSP